MIEHKLCSNLIQQRRDGVAEFRAPDSDLSVKNVSNLYALLIPQSSCVLSAVVNHLHDTVVLQQVLQLKHDVRADLQYVKEVALASHLHLRGAVELSCIR